MAVKLRKKRTNPKIKSNKYSLYLDIYSNGKRKFEFLKLYIYKPARNKQQTAQTKENLKLAESIRAKRELLINTTENGFDALIKGKTNFFDFAQTVMSTKNNRDYKAALNHFKTFIETDYIPIGTITPETLETFKDYLKSNLKENTAFNYLARIKTIFKEAVKYGIIAKNPADHVKNIKVHDTEIIYLTLPEVQKLVNTECKKPEIKKAFLFSCNTGLRFATLKQITLENISGNLLQYRHQKTKEPIIITLNSNALQLIDKSKTGFVFDLPKDIGTVNKVLSKWTKKAGIKKHITFHKARNTFATNLLYLDTDVYVVSKLLGHTTLKHTVRYAKVVKALKERATNKLPDYENSNGTN